MFCFGGEEREQSKAKRGGKGQKEFAVT